MIPRALTLAVCLCASQIRGDTATPTTSDNIADPEKAGLELAKRVLVMVPRENSSLRGVLKIRDAQGRTAEVGVTSQVLSGGKTWQVSYIAKPAGWREEKLTIVHAPDRPNEYIYSTGSNATANAQPQRLSGSQANIPFAGSDFWLSDLGLEFLHWPKQRIVKTEMRLGQWCNVLDSINPQAANGYARVRSWLDKKTGGPIVAEGYDKSDRLVKDFRLKHFSHVQGEWQLKEMEIRSPLQRTRTRLEFDLDSK
jgi:hypothetical protein